MTSSVDTDACYRSSMITCYLRYVIDPYQLDVFEAYARRWIELVNRSGGQHHGYFMPLEGADNISVALFSFPSLAAYEQYRALFQTDPDFIAANQIREQSRCVVSYERSFMRPVFA